MKYIKYILILIILVGTFSSTIKADARALTTTEQQQVAAQRAIITATQAEYDMVRESSGGTAAQQAASTQRYNDLVKLRNAATSEISYIQTMADKNVAPATIQFNLNPNGAIPTGNCILKDGSTAQITQADCGLIKDSQSWNGASPTSGTTGNCLLRSGGDPISMTQANCEANPNSQSWNGISTSSAKGNCLLKNGASENTTQANCEANTNSQSWNGAPTSSANGECLLQSGAKIQTTQVNCQLNTNSKSWNGTLTTWGAKSFPTASYKLLEPLPCPPGSTNCTSGQNLTTVDTTKGLGDYLNLMLKLFIGICAVLAVIMIVVGGMEYMTSELVHTKEAGKDRITHAILGLLIALGAYALLFTINPDLLKSDVDTKTPDVTLTPPTLLTSPSATGSCSISIINNPSACATSGGTWTTRPATPTAPTIPTTYDVVPPLPTSGTGHCSMLIFNSPSTCTTGGGTWTP